MIPFFIKINILWYCYRSRMLSELLWLSMINDIKLSSFYPLGFFSPRRHAIKDIFHWCNIWQLQRAESRIRIWWSYLNHHSFPPTLSILSLSVMGRVGKRIIGILNSWHKTHELSNNFQSKSEMIGALFCFEIDSRFCYICTLNQIQI